MSTELYCKVIQHILLVPQSLPFWSQCLLGPCFLRSFLCLNTHWSNNFLTTYLNSTCPWPIHGYNDLEGVFLLIHCRVKAVPTKLIAGLWFSWTQDQCFNRFSRHHGTTSLLRMQQDWGTELYCVPLKVSPSVFVLLRQKLNILSLFEDSLVLFVICQSGLEFLLY